MADLLWFYPLIRWHFSWLLCIDKMLCIKVYPHESGDDCDNCCHKLILNAVNWLAWRHLLEFWQRSLKTQVPNVSFRIDIQSEGGAMRWGVYKKSVNQEAFWARHDWDMRSRRWWWLLWRTGLVRPRTYMMELWIKSYDVMQRSHCLNVRLLSS